MHYQNRISKYRGHILTAKHIDHYRVFLDDIQPQEERLKDMIVDLFIQPPYSPVRKDLETRGPSSEEEQQTERAHR
jgi:hypothetical protein